MAKPERFVLTATVDAIKPDIWRQIDVSGQLTLGDLHVLLQLCLDWHNAHMHMFSATPPYARGPRGKQWGPPSPWEVDQDLLPEDAAALEDVFADLNGPLFYEYDFGDSWLVVITAEKSTSEETRIAVVTDGARRGPVEDSGGVPGYLDLLEVLADPQHEDHSWMREWVDETVDGKFDPEDFDREALNATIQRSQS